MFHRGCLLIAGLLLVTAVAVPAMGAGMLQTSSEIFPLQTEVPVAGEAKSVSVADLDNDGDIDLVVANDFTQFVSILLNRGDGSYEPKVDYQVVASPWGTCVADFNGDTYADIAVANYNTYSPGAVSVLMGNGDGTFQSAVNYDTDNAPKGIVAADFDNDSDMDLAVENESGWTITILSNNGSGQFASTGSVQGIYDVAAADFDGDNDVDFATAVPTTDSIAIYYNNGSGVFSSAVTRYCGNWLFSMHAADIDGDSFPDLITVGANSNTISVLHNNGSGDLQLQEVISVGSSPRSAWVADVDHDGLSDIAVCNGNNYNVELLRQTAPGVFQSAGTVAVGHQPSAVIAVDLDQDQDVDLAVSNRYGQNVSILYNAVNFSYTCGDVNGTHTPVDIADLTSMVNYMFKQGTAPYLLPAANVDGNLGIDIADLTYLVNFMFKAGADPICQ